MTVGMRMTAGFGAEVIHSYGRMTRPSQATIFHPSRLHTLPGNLGSLIQNSPWHGIDADAASQTDALARRMILARADGRLSETIGRQNWFNPEVFSSILRVLRTADPKTNTVHYGLFPLVFQYSKQSAVEPKNWVIGHLEILEAESATARTKDPVLVVFAHKQLQSSETSWLPVRGVSTGVLVRLELFGPRANHIAGLVAQIHPEGLSLLDDIAIYCFEKHFGAMIHDPTNRDITEEHDGLAVYWSSNIAIRQSMGD